MQQEMSDLVRYCEPLAYWSLIDAHTYNTTPIPDDEETRHIISEMCTLDM